MANDHFMPQFAELVGSWESLETNTGESALTATSGSDKVRSESDEEDLASHLNDNTPKLSWSQLRTIVDLIVDLLLAFIVICFMDLSVDCSVTLTLFFIVDLFQRCLSSKSPGQKSTT